jgi:hypothetical protein
VLIGGSAHGYQETFVPLAAQQPPIVAQSDCQPNRIFIHRCAWDECPLLPRGVRAAQAQGKITPAGQASWKQMSKSPSRRFPVTVTQLPVARCEICHRTVAYRPGSLSEVLTEHHRRAHPEALGIPSRYPSAGCLHYTAGLVTGVV